MVFQSRRFLLSVLGLHCFFVLCTGNLIYYARRPEKLVLEELAREEGIEYHHEEPDYHPPSDAAVEEPNPGSESEYYYPNCTSFDAVHCCLSATNLPCSEFIQNLYYKEVCGEQCGIPCIDDITGDNDIGIIVDANDDTAVCLDDKPPVCCDFLRKNHLCRTELFNGCSKSCDMCKTPNVTMPQPPPEKILPSNMKIENF